ncbi:DsbA family oxidoreductase [Streptomyces sp. TLI_105]|uniref:DsbA family oxidoreductase n=1 Tax=Streptomyces sp. TLI_105 TaxID=1881019 RepID=UPI00089D636C|nr:DsbA family oxidoreductase [Streptomyces sp. TLI_105]SED18415.1 Predicted dithiol-disulfide isomerase, DsbA family [Streptomyces sp. TLI_105]
MKVEIWSDITCPWCYVAQARFEKALAVFPHRAGVEVVHKSYELEPGRAKGDVEPIIKVLMKGKGWTEAQALANERNLTIQSADEGLPYVAGRDHGSTFHIHRLLHFAKARGKQHELVKALYRANFAEEESIFADDERLVALAVEVGLDADAARSVLAAPNAYADEVRADEREASQLGVSGVPFFVFDRQYGVSGAQSTEAFTRALTQAWGDRSPLQLVDGADDAHACGPDGCPVPH